VVVKEVFALTGSYGRLNEREPFLLLAKEAASSLLDARVKPKETAYQFFMSDSFAETSARHPTLSLAELTSQVLAPRWNALSKEERAPFEELAARDARRWQHEHKVLQERTNAFFCFLSFD
jgi:hypothetical protein